MTMREVAKSICGREMGNSGFFPRVQQWILSWQLENQYWCCLNSQTAALGVV